MKIKLPPILEQFAPFAVLGTLLVAAFWLLIIFSYVLFWGALIGVFIWGVQRIKAYWFASSPDASPPLNPKKPGRIIEHDQDK